MTLHTKNSSLLPFGFSIFGEMSAFSRLNEISQINCCGCSACVQRCPKHCISVEENEEGFLYPFINEEYCIDCGLCKKVCPAINQGEQRKPLQVYAAKNKNERIREKSSSGGVFTLLAEQIIGENGVVFGARFDENWEVTHDYVKTKEDLAHFRGSKYVQSRIGNTYQQAEQFLKMGRHVLFSGTPCQIAGLKLFLQKEYDNLLTVDFVCHGVPSPKVWRTYLNQLAENQLINFRWNKIFSSKKEIITNVNFRDKTYGWKRYCFTFQFSPCVNKKPTWYVEPFYKNVFMKGFLQNLYLRSSCYACPSKSLKSGSDITIGDYWGIQDVLPEFDDDKGVSLVMINTQKGRTVYSLLKKESVETTYSNALAGNSCIEKSVAMPLKRSIFFERKENRNIIELINELTHINITLNTRIKNKMNAIINSIIMR